MKNNNEEMNSLNEVKKILFDEGEIDWRERYERLVSGEYGAFEIWNADGDASSYRGFRKNYGTTSEYPTYKEAVEAAMEEYDDV
jgi:predicted secreted protein